VCFVPNPDLSKTSIHNYLLPFFSQTEHPFEAEREYTRALNSVKLEKVFAKPFLGALDGHRQTGFHQLIFIVFLAILFFYQQIKNL
jgi:hypothetical protein